MAAEIRIATFNTELSRDGPGLFLRDILKAESPDIDATADLIAGTAPDAILLQGIDWDHGLAALAAFRDIIAAKGADYPHLFALRPNTGMQTGRDLDGNGRTGDPRDAQGYGRFAGVGGMAILSRWPVTAHRDHSATLWTGLPGNLTRPEDPGLEIQRLSTTGHWSVSLDTGTGPLHLLAFHATPPVFDGPEDRNGRRNHDEAAFWSAYLDGTFGPAPDTRFILLGDANLDPEDGDGRSDAIRALLTDPRLQDPEPASQTAETAAIRDGGANAMHTGNPALDTANWRDDGGPGNLRVDYVLPSADWTVIDAGVAWPRDGSRHGLVWVDLATR